MGRENVFISVLKNIKWFYVIPIVAGLSVLFNFDAIKYYSQGILDIGIVFKEFFGSMFFITIGYIGYKTVREIFSKK